MTLGQKIKKIRIEKNYTQKDLADKVHVTFQTISKWENDENEPDVATLRELAKVFDCSLNYLLSEEDEEVIEEPKKEETVVVPIVVPQKEEKQEETPKPTQYTCHVCHKPIMEGDLATVKLTKRIRHGRHHKTIPDGEAHYHKACLEKENNQRKQDEIRRAKYRRSHAEKVSFGWSIAAGVVAFAIALTIFIINAQKVNIGLGILFSVLICYGIFSMIYCILTGSYIGEVFVWCASLSIKFPGLIFSWDIDGIIWVITMKLVFAILGFLIGLLALAFGICFSSALSAISFPFVLIHNNNNDYEDALFN